MGSEEFLSDGPDLPHVILRVSVQYVQDAVSVWMLLT